LWATAFFLAGNRMTIVAFEKEVSLKSLSFTGKNMKIPSWFFMGVLL